MSVISCRRAAFSAVFLCLAFAVLEPVTATAAPQCNDRDQVLAQLADKYKEAPVAQGVTNNGGLVEVLTSDGGETWTIVVTLPSGATCLIAAGENWRWLDHTIEDPEA